MKTLYAVTFTYGGRTMFAIRSNKPTGLYTPERRCLFKDRKIANDLERFLKRESTFRDIRVQSVEV